MRKILFLAILIFSTGSVYALDKDTSLAYSYLKKAFDNKNKDSIILNLSKAANLYKEAGFFDRYKAIKMAESSLYLNKGNTEAAHNTLQVVLSTDNLNIKNDSDLTVFLVGIIATILSTIISFFITKLSLKQSEKHFSIKNKSQISEDEALRHFLEEEYQYNLEKYESTQAISEKQKYIYRFSVSFAFIKQRMGGLSDMELRKALIRAGAIRVYEKIDSFSFENLKKDAEGFCIEKWILLEKVKELKMKYKIDKFHDFSYKDEKGNLICHCYSIKENDKRLDKNTSY